VGSGPFGGKASIPRELDALVLRCLAKDPAHRYASGTELAAALGGLQGRSFGTGAPPPGTEPRLRRASAQAVTTLSSSSGSTLTSVGASSRRILGVAAALVVAGGITAAVMTRGGRAATSGAPGTGSTAHVVAPSTTAPPQVAPPQVAPPVVPPPPPPDAETVLAQQMKVVLTGFVAWARAHAGAPCPKAAELAVAIDDPWGNPMEITCTDQPANQVIGVISSGPDRARGTSDDLGSWQFGREVTEIARGARWAPAARPVAAKPVAVKPEPAKPDAAKPDAAKPDAAKPDRPDKPARPRTVVRPRPSDSDIPTER
jgi:hypothetical protein